MKTIIMKYRQFRMNRLIKKVIRSLADEAIADYNRKLPLIRHLEESKSHPQNFNNTSPIPRHDISEYNKMMMSQDLKKYSHTHPNPKMEGSPYIKNRLTTTSNYLNQYKTVFNYIKPPEPNTDQDS